MTLNSSLPDPHEWHSATSMPCPICGLDLNHQNETVLKSHRRVRPGESYVTSHVYRFKRSYQPDDLRYKPGGTWHIRPCFRPHSGRVTGPKNRGNRSANRGKNGQSGPTSTTRAAIEKATAMLANGRRRSDVAASLKTNIANLADWQFTWPDLWNACYDAAIKPVRETVRQLAGTPSMPEDLDTFVLAGVRAAEWSESRGEKLIDRGDALTLREFYERHYLPLRPQGKKTIEFHRVVLRRWAVLTGDPPLADTTKAHLALFRDSLSKMRGGESVAMSPNTVAAYMKRVQTLLDKAGPAGPRNRDAMEFIAKVPWVKPPREIHRAVRTVSEETLNKFYLGCVAALRPKSPDFKPPAWWRALVVVPYNLGLRRGTLFELQMQWIKWERRLIIIPPDVANKTGQEQILPMNAVVFDHLHAIRGDRERVFEFGRCIDKYFYTYWHRLQTACGIPREQHFGLHDLRRTCATVLWEHNPQVAQFALGHSSPRMTRKHYVLGQGMLARAVEQMPQPSAFGGERLGGTTDDPPINGRKDRR